MLRGFVRRWAGLGNHPWNACVRSAPNHEACHIFLVLFSWNTWSLRVCCHIVSGITLCSLGIFRACAGCGIFIFENSMVCLSPHAVCASSILVISVCTVDCREPADGLEHAVAIRFVRPVCQPWRPRRSGSRTPRMIRIGWRRRLIGSSKAERNPMRDSCRNGQCMTTSCELPQQRSAHPSLRKRTPSL